MKRQTIALFCIAALSIISCAKEGDKKDDSKYTDEQKASYYIGMSIAQNMKQEGFKVDAELLAQGIKEEMDSTKKKMLPAEEMNSFMQDFMMKQQQKQSEAGAQSSDNKKKVWNFWRKIKVIQK